MNTRQTNVKCIVSLVCSIIGIFLFGIILEPLAIIFGAVGMTEIKNNPEVYGGYGMGIAGVIIGAIGTILSLIGLVAMFSIM